jgi:alkylated DNA nucleotide flippase Atl1
VIFDFNETERRLIKILVKHLPNVRPGDAKTHLSYGQVHEMLGLTMHGKTVGVSLTVQGLGKIAEWARAISAPAITGVVVDRESSRPSAKFFELYGRSSEDYKSNGRKQLSMLIQRLSICQLVRLKSLGPVV